MYVPPHFEEARGDELHRIIGQYPLGALVINGPNGLDVSHVPIELDAASGQLGILRAHVARANPLWTEVRDGEDVLVIFRAADACISPNWQASWLLAQQKIGRHACRSTRARRAARNIVLDFGGG